MGKLLNPKDVLMLGLAGVVDVYEEIKDPFGIKAYGAKELYGWVPRRFKKHNLSRLLMRELKTGEIEKVVKNGEVYLRLTSVGEKRIVRDFPLLAFKEKKWDGKWRTVIFDIAEIDRKKRDRIRDKLKELGFGMLQESVWITPHNVSVDMREYVESNGLGAFIFVLEVSGILAGDKQFLIEKIWKLKSINNEYLEIASEAENLKKMYIESHDRGSLYTSKYSNRSQKLREKYLQILLIDPCLPKELLPKDWAGEKVRKAIKNLC